MMAVISGFNKCYGYAIHLDINRFGTPYFCFGLNYNREFTRSMEVSILTVGFVVCNVQVEFFKLLSPDEEEIIKDGLLKLNESE